MEIIPDLQIICYNWPSTLWLGLVRYNKITVRLAPALVGYIPVREL